MIVHEISLKCFVLPEANGNGSATVTIGGLLARGPRQTCLECIDAGDFLHLISKCHGRPGFKSDLPLCLGHPQKSHRSHFSSAPLSYECRESTLSAADLTMASVFSSKVLASNQFPGKDQPILPA